MNPKKGKKLLKLNQSTSPLQSNPKESQLQAIKEDETQ